MSARPSGESHSDTDLGYASKPVIEENKAQDSTEYTDASVLKDQSGQSSKSTTIPEGSAACNVSTSSSTKEIQAVTHAFQWTALTSP